VGQVEHLVGLVEPKSLENLEMTKREIVSFFVGLGVGLAALLALVCVFLLRAFLASRFDHCSIRSAHRRTCFHSALKGSYYPCRFKLTHHLENPTLPRELAVVSPDPQPVAEYEYPTTAAERSAVFRCEPPKPPRCSRSAPAQAAAHTHG
jgi:hypothetical protein